MKHSKRCKATVGAFVWGIVCLMIVPLSGMISQKSTSKRIRLPQPVQQEQAERYKSKLIWVKTSDNIRMELPLWQIDQMKALQHKGEHTQYHWVDAPMITSDELALVQKALNVADNLEKWKIFYSNLPEDQKESLVTSASKLEMQKLTSLLMAYTFPIEVQKQIGASVMQAAGVIAPVVEYLQSADNQIRILKGHQRVVRCVAYSPDGNSIVSGSDDKNLILWDGKTGEQIRILKGHQAGVKCVAYSPDGNSIVSGSADNNLILWDGKTGEQIKILKGHNDFVDCVAYSPDGNYIVSGSLDHNLILWDGKTGEQIKILKGHNDFVDCVAYSPDGNYIVSGSRDKNLILWDGKTGEQIKILKGHNTFVSCLAYSPDGNSIVSGSRDKNLILWDGKTGEQIKILKGHQAGVDCVAYSPDGNYIVSGSLDHNLILWDGKTGEQIKILKGHNTFVSCLAYSPDGNYIVSGSWDKNLTVWGLLNAQVLDYIANKLNIAQARFLYRLYLAKINKMPVILDNKDLDYQLYLTLPPDVQKVVKAFLPFELLSDVTEKAVHVREKAVQEKMQEYRSLLFYSSSYFFGKSEKTRDQKIKAIKDIMYKFDKDSIESKACERLLRDLEKGA